MATTSAGTDLVTQHAILLQFDFFNAFSPYTQLTLRPLAEHEVSDTLPPVVSVLSCTYNHENFIAQCIEGFLNQVTTFSVEIVIHDDASKDRTQEIVRHYQTRFPNIVKPILQRENQYSKRDGFLKRMLATTRGKYIALCDGDDFWIDAGKLQLQVDFLEKNPSHSSCFHNVTVLDQSGCEEEKPWLTRDALADGSDITFLRMLEGNMIATSSLVCRGDILRSLPDWIGTLAIGDWPIHLINAHHGPIRYFDKTMSVYRLNHGANIWSQKAETERDRRSAKLKQSESITAMYLAIDKHFDGLYSNIIRTRVGLHLMEQSTHLAKLGYHKASAKRALLAWQMDPLFRRLMMRETFGLIWHGMARSVFKSNAPA